MHKNRRVARAALASAAASAARNPDDPAAAAAVIERRREYEVLTLEEHILRVVDQAPPLTDEQIERLRELFPPCDSSAALSLGGRMEASAA